MRKRLSLGGFCVSAAYLLIATAVFVLTMVSTQPGNVGLDWIPLMLLSAPWYAIHHNWLLGIVLNAVLMYLLGFALESLYWRIVGRRS